MGHNSLNLCVTNTEHTLLYLVRAVIASGPKCLGCAFSCSEPLVSMFSFFLSLPPHPFYFILFFHLEASSKASVNGLTYPLLLKQCGVGPFFALCAQRREHGPQWSTGAPGTRADTSGSTPFLSTGMSKIMVISFIGRFILVLFITSTMLIAVRLLLVLVVGSY